MTDRVQSPGDCPGWGVNGHICKWCDPETVEHLEHVSSNRVHPVTGYPVCEFGCTHAPGRRCDCECHAIPKREATTVGVDEMLAQSDPEATQITNATRNRAAGRKEYVE